MRQQNVTVVEVKSSFIRKECITSLNKSMLNKDNSKNFQSQLKKIC